MNCSASPRVIPPKLFAWRDALPRVPLFVTFCLTILTSGAFAAEAIPPKPDRYFNDYAHVVSSSTAASLNDKLAQFERDTSNQVVVAIYPKMQSDSSIEDYAQRIAQSWGVGQKDRRNGVVLFAFMAEHKMSIQVGYGLEGALPDAIAFDIRENHIKPLFRAGDYDKGLTVGVDLICKAIQGEYHGTGRTLLDGQHQRGETLPPVIMIIIFSLFLIRFVWAVRRGFRYSGHSGPYVSGGWGGWGGSGGGWSSGGGGDSGGFSAGGGSFGGGGSSGSW